MTITAKGIKEVEEEYERALIEEERAIENLNAARERVDMLRESLECPHEEHDLEYYAGIIYEQTVCRRCGFTWDDF